MPLESLGRWKEEPWGQRAAVSFSPRGWPVRAARGRLEARRAHSLPSVTRVRPTSTSTVTMCPKVQNPRPKPALCSCQGRAPASLSPPSPWAPHPSPRHPPGGHPPQMSTRGPRRGFPPHGGVSVLSSAHLTPAFLSTSATALLQCGGSPTQNSPQGHPRSGSPFAASTQGWTTPPSGPLPGTEGPGDQGGRSVPPS